MPPPHPSELFSRETGHHLFHGLLIELQNGGRVLLPLQEITWISAAALEDGEEEGGCVEIQTRQRTVRLGLSRMDACTEFMELLLKGGVNRIAEGTAPPVLEYGVIPGKSARPAVTLVVEIVEAGKEDEKEDPDSPDPSGGRPGFGFPTL